MAIFACPACKSRVTVADEQRGRTLKCPSCSTSFKVPAAVPAASAPSPGAAPQPAPKQTATKKAAPSKSAPQPIPANQKPVKPSAPAAKAPAPKEKAVEISELDVVEVDAPEQTGEALRLQSFEELEVPQRLEEAIRDELTSKETILWLGRPSLRLFMARTWLAVPFGVILTIIAIVLFIFMVIPPLTGKGETLHLVLGLVFFIMFLLFGLALGTMPWWVAKLKRYRDCYVLTNSRALVVDNSGIFRCKIHSYYPDDLLRMERQDSSKFEGAGDLVFEVVMVDVGTRMSHHRNTTTISDHKIPQPRGFLMIENVRDVERLIRQTLLNKR